MCVKLTVISVQKLLYLHQILQLYAKVTASWSCLTDVCKSHLDFLHVAKFERNSLLKIHLVIQKAIFLTSQIIEIFLRGTK